MAVEARGYERQRGDARMTPLSGADPSSFGADVGRAIAGLGSSVHRAEISAYQVERQQKADQEAADFTARFAAARERMDRLSIDMRSNAAPGAAGHADAMAQAWDAEKDALTQGITETRLLQNARGQLDQFGSRLRTSEYEYEQGARVGKLVTDFRQASEISVNRARLAHDPKSFAEELAFGRDAIEQMQGVPADVKDKLAREHDQQVAVGYLNGLNDSNPAAALALLDAGAFTDMLDPAQVEQARNGAQVELRRAQASANAQAGLQRQALRDEVETVNAQIAAGVEIPDAQLADLQGRLSAIGDEGGATKMGIARAEAGVRRVADLWKPEEFDERINALAAKKSRTAQDDIELATLRKMKPGAVSTFNNNPGEWAAKNGFAPPAIDLDNGGSFGARAAWARTVTAQTGRQTPLFTDAEVRQLRDEASASQQAMVDVAGRIAAFGGRDAQRAAKQVLPTDPMLARMVALDGDSRAAVLRGSKVRQANKAVVDGSASQDVAAHFYEILGAAAQNFDGQEVGAVLDVAKNLYADAQARKGAFDWETNGKVEDLNPYINIALGGRKGADGFWRGGLGQWKDSPMLLPDGWTQGAFDRVLSRVQFRADSRTAPVWSDGRQMSAAELRGYVPVRRADGRYEFHGPNNTVARQRNGAVYALDIEAVGRGIGVVRRGP